MKTDTKDRDRFDPWRNKDDNQNIQYEKRNGKAFNRSYRMNLSRTAEFIAEFSTNWDEVPWPNDDLEGSNDYNEKSASYCLEE